MTNLLQSLSNIVTALANGRLMRVVGWKMINVLPRLSNVVNALADGRLLRVEARGLLAGRPCSRQEDCCQSLEAHNFAPRRARADLTAD
jgi:hypothetical protein